MEQRPVPLSWCVANECDWKSPCAHPVSTRLSSHSHCLLRVCACHCRPPHCALLHLSLASALGQAPQSPPDRSPLVRQKQTTVDREENRNRTVVVPVFPALIRWLVSTGGEFDGGIAAENGRGLASGGLFLSVRFSWPRKGTSARAQQIAWSTCVSLVLSVSLRCTGVTVGGDVMQALSCRRK